MGREFVNFSNISLTWRWKQDVLPKHKRLSVKIKSHQIPQDNYLIYTLATVETKNITENTGRLSADWQSNTELGAEYRPLICHMLSLSMHHVDVNTLKDIINLNTLCPKQGTRWGSCLWHCAISRKVAASIPDGVTGSFLGQKPSDRTMA